MAPEGVCFLFVSPTYVLIHTVLQPLYTDKNATASHPSGLSEVSLMTFSLYLAEQRLFRVLKDEKGRREEGKLK